jgi:hypothetical protein
MFLYETCRLRRRFSIGVRTKCELQSRTATRKFAAEERLSTRRSVDEEINAVSLALIDEETDRRGDSRREGKLTRRRRSDMLQREQANEELTDHKLFTYSPF